MGPVDKSEVITLLSLLGYGDSLITASLLERAGAQAAQIRIAGTQITARVAELMYEPRPPDEILFDEVPAFYAIKKHGPVKALMESLKLRRWALERFRTGEVLIFEKPPSVRNRWIVTGSRCHIIEVPKITTVYEDRATVFAPLIGDHPFPRVKSPHGRARTLLINPSARIRSKELPKLATASIITIANKRQVEVTLVDVDGSFAHEACRVPHYLLRPKLQDAAKALKMSDRYIGPDSFFLHLAYYYGIPELVFFPDGNNYFRPPGLFDQGCGHYLKDLENSEFLESRLAWFLG